MRILLVASDNQLLNRLIFEFKNVFIVDTAKEASKAISLSESTYYDAIIVDATLLDIEGLELCKMMREFGVESPTALLSGRDDRSDRVMCFDAGVDVVLPRCACSEEISAQVKVLTRRNGSQSNCRTLLKFGNITLDTKNKLFYINENLIYLRRKEFDLLEYLLIHHGRPVPKEELLEHVWEKGLDVLSNTVEVHIRSVRTKLEREAGVKIIKTHRGFGYEIET